MEENTIEIKRDRIIALLKNKNAYIYLILLLAIIWYSSSVRLSNLPLLKDATTNDYITADPDASLYLRYAEEIVSKGSLSEIDSLRYYPRGLPTIEANPIIPYIIAWLYRIANTFNNNITVGFADVAIYPIVFYILGIFAFYLLVSKLFNNKVAVLSSFILAVLPTYLFRTMAGVGDKEVFAMFLMFLVLYFYLIAWHAESSKKAIAFGLLAGISTGIMNLAWNGANFIFMLIALSSLIDVFLDRFNRNDLYAYLSWIIPTTLILIIFRYGIAGILNIVFFSITSSIAYFSLSVAIVYLILKTKRFEKISAKITSRLHLGIASILISVVIATILSSILVEPLFMYNKITSIFSSLIHPFGLGRLTLTVAESYQPYFTDWISTFSWSYLLLFLLASVYLFYMLIKPLKNNSWKLTIAYTLFLLFFIPTRYSRNAAVFNGETATSNFLYIGSLIAFLLLLAAVYLYGYYRNKDIFEEFKKFDKKYIFLFIWLFLMIVAARGAIRLFFTLAPVTAILSSYLIVEAIEKLLKLKDRLYKYTAIAIIAFLLLSPFPFYSGILIKFAKSTSQAAKFTGPGYNEQWQYAMKWVRENTPEDAVFSHWWDYGYWVQTGGRRATVLDGGNHVAYWDTLMGRYVLTAQLEEQALEFMKTHDSTYLLIDPTDIGKYPAYSSIGSNENFDRLSYIAAFLADPLKVQETRNETIYLYEGQFVLDEDFVYQGKLYPKNSAGIIGFRVPVESRGQETIIKQPTAALVYKNNLIEIPLQCVNFDNQLYQFSNAAIKGCIKLVPTFDSSNIQNRNLNFPAGALYISERSMRALWVRLYLLQQDTDNFKLAYTDETSIPIAIFQGQIIGPLKIWKVSYPDSIKVRPEYLNTTGPEFL